MAEASRTREDGDGEVDFGALIAALEERGFGPVMIALASFLILPTGMIPGMPALIGAMLILVSVQMLAGRSSLWIPARLRRFALPADKVDAGVSRIRPWSRRVGRLIRPRLQGLVRSPAGPRLAALGALISGATAIPLGFIPMLPLFLSLPVLCFGAALTARDGLVMLMGLAAYAPALYALWMHAA